MNTIDTISNANIDTPVFDKVAAQQASPSGRVKTIFRCEVTFGNDSPPQVVVQGSYSARACIDAAREWALQHDRKTGLKRFGQRVGVTVERTRQGETVQVKIPAAKNPTAREVMMAQALNGGGVSIDMDDFALSAYFVGYIPAR